MMLLGVQSNQRIEGGKHSGSAVKLVKQQTCQSTWPIEWTASIAVKSERSSPGRDPLFQKDFCHRRESSLSAKEGLSPLWKHIDHD